LSLDLENHPDRLKWNARYLDPKPSLVFGSAPIYDLIHSVGLADGPILELACGMSSIALDFAAEGRDVCVVDISDIALDRLTRMAHARRLSDKLQCVQADLNTWQPPEGRAFALVVCVMYWERGVFDYAWPLVAHQGMLAWQGFTMEHLRYRSSQNPAWCLDEGEPFSILPGDQFEIQYEKDIDEGHRVIRRMIAKRRSK